MRAGTQTVDCGTVALWRPQPDAGRYCHIRCIAYQTSDTLHSSLKKTRASHAENAYLFAAGGRAPAAQRGRLRRNYRTITTHRQLPPGAHWLPHMDTDGERLPHKHMCSAQAYVRENLPRCGEAAPTPCSAAGAPKEYSVCEARVLKTPFTIHHSHDTRCSRGAQNGLKNCVNQTQCDVKVTASPVDEILQNTQKNRNHPKSALLSSIRGRNTWK